MAVAVDATATAVTVGSAVTTASNTTLTVGVGATALLAWVESSTTLTSPTVTWDSGGTNQAMTPLGSQAITNGWVALYGLLAPTSGNKSLVASWTGSANMLLDAISFTGTATSTVASAFKNFTSSAPVGTSGTLTVAGAVGNIQVVGGAQNVNVFTSLTATGSTQVFKDSTHVAGIGCRAPSAASLVWTAVVATSTTIDLVGVDVAAPASASSIQWVQPASQPMQRPVQLRHTAVFQPPMVAAAASVTPLPWLMPLSQPQTRSPLTQIVFLPQTIFPAVAFVVSQDASMSAEFISQVAEGQPISLEFISQVAEGQPISLEFISQMTEGQPSSLEFISQVAEGQPISLEFLSQMTESAALRQETLSQVAEGATLPLEFANTSRVDAVQPAEALASVQETSPTPVEFSGALSVLLDSGLPLESLSQLTTSQTLDAEQLSALSAAGPVMAELLSQVRGAAVQAAETLVSVQETSSTPAEFSGALSVLMDAVYSLESLSQVAGGGPQSAETTTAMTTLSGQPSEALSSSASTAPTPAERLVSETTSSPLPAEMLSLFTLVFADESLSLELLGGVLEDGRLGLEIFALVEFVRGRTILLRSDTGDNMQLPSLFSFSVAGPVDNDPFTFDFTRWLAMIPGDRIQSATMAVTHADGSAQTSVGSTSQTLNTSGTMYTMWLSGGIIGTTYVVSVTVTTVAGRADTKSANLVVAQFRS